MSILEDRSRKRKQQRDLQRLILETIALSGIISVALVAPNVLGAMKKVGLLPHKRQKESIARARNRLIKKGLLVQNKESFLRITPQGKKVFEKMQILKHGLPKPKRWDGRWRVLIFDIPNYRKGLRAKVRRSLNVAGFILFQKSVWVYPHNCEDFIALLKADFKVGKDMRYLIADTIEDDALRKYFGLKRKP